MVWQVRKLEANHTTKSKMTKLYLLLLLCVGITPIFSQTLFTYGNYAVSKDEFLKAYNKNKTPVTDKEAALKEYLDL
jgi:peptidyl-prolyl cis-trans isomerase SurA